MTDRLRRRWASTALLLAVATGGAIDLALDSPARRTASTSRSKVRAARRSRSARSRGCGSAGRARGGALASAHAGRLLAQHRTRRVAGARRDAAARTRRSDRGAVRSAGICSAAERETALLLLKGYGHKEIAELLGKSERTVRQQSIAVYRKSGLAGRAQLSAFFLEDLLLPSSSAPPAGDAEPD